MSFRNYFWSRGEPWRSIRSWGVPRLLRAAHSVLMCSVRLTASGIGPAWKIVSGEAAREQEIPHTGALFVTWHDLTLLPLHLFRHRNVGAMISHSRAGQMQAAFWSLYGWRIIWGSTKKREGIQALREVTRLLREGQSIAFTPDGPKGPRHEAQPGIIYLASRTPTIVMPLGVAASSAWRLPTWDRYLIPKPFARVHVHIGEPLEIPREIHKDQTAYWQGRVKQIIDEAQDEAARQMAARS